MLTDGQAVYPPGVSENRGGVSRFNHLDALGHLRGQTNAAKILTDTLTSDAFGQTVSQSGSGPLPFGFEADAQYQTDSDSGLTLVGNRYYDAAIGRYLQPDPSGAEDNDYAYAENNPLSDDDPDGLQSTKPTHGQTHRKLRKQPCPCPNQPKHRGRKGTGKSNKGTKKTAGKNGKNGANGKAGKNASNKKKGIKGDGVTIENCNGCIVITGSHNSGASTTSQNGTANPQSGGSGSGSSNGDSFGKKVGKAVGKGAVRAIPLFGPLLGPILDPVIDGL